MNRRATALYVAMALAISSCGELRANLIFNISEIGEDVVFSGSGSVDLAGLTKIDTATSAQVNPASLFRTGPTSFTAVDLYLGSVTGPSSIGPGSTSFYATSGSGDLMGLNGPSLGSSAALILPNGYTTGSTLAASSTYASQTLGSLGLTAGSYAWAIGANSVTLNIATVPEPGLSVYLVTSLVVTVAYIRCTRSQSQC